MANTDFDNVISLLNRWETHWEDVNSALGAPLVIGGTEFSLGSLANERDALISEEQTILAAENTAQGAATVRDAARAALRTRVTQLRAGVQGILLGTRYVGMLPRLPASNAGEGVFLRGLEDCASLWEQINADTTLGALTPLLLPTSYTQAQFADELTALRGHCQSAAQNREHARTLRAGRTARRKVLLARLTQYRKVLVARLPAGHPLLGTVPSS